MAKAMTDVGCTAIIFPTSVSPSGCHLKVNCPKGAREATLGCLPREKALACAFL